MKTKLLDLTLEEFGNAVSPSYRARQIFKWVYEKRCFDFAGMTDLPSALAAELAAKYDLMPARVVESVSNADAQRTDGAEKFLIEFAAGARVETVLIYDDGRATVCLSTQAGCPVRCAFCASGFGGLKRSLTAGEIMAQYLLAEGHLRQAAKRDIDNVVLMGTGEPLLNYDNTLRFLRAALAPWGLGKSARRITLSTVGIIKNIRRLAEEDLKINLAISLHAPDDATRSLIVPHNDGIAGILAAARHYFQITGREVTFEYVLIAGVNAEKEHALALARLLRDFQCTVNLISLNPSENLPREMRPPTSRMITDFQRTLRAAGVKTTLRKSKGSAIRAACGQLRGRQKTEDR